MENLNYLTGIIFMLIFLLVASLIFNIIRYLRIKKKFGVLDILIAPFEFLAYIFGILIAKLF